MAGWHSSKSLCKISARKKFKEWVHKLFIVIIELYAYCM